MLQFDIWHLLVCRGKYKN